MLVQMNESQRQWLNDMKRKSQWLFYSSSFSLSQRMLRLSLTLSDLTRLEVRNLRRNIIRMYYSTHNNIHFHNSVWWHAVDGGSNLVVSFRIVRLCNAKIYIYIYVCVRVYVCYCSFLIFKSWPFPTFGTLVALPSSAPPPLLSLLSSLTQSRRTRERETPETRYACLFTCLFIQMVGFQKKTASRDIHKAIQNIE